MRISLQVSTNPRHIMSEFPHYIYKHIDVRTCENKWDIIFLKNHYEFSMRDVSEAISYELHVEHAGKILKICVLLIRSNKLYNCLNECCAFIVKNTRAFRFSKYEPVSFIDLCFNTKYCFDYTINRILSFCLWILIYLFIEEVQL